MALPLRLLLLFAAVAGVVAIVVWPNSVSLPFQPDQPYTGPGFVVASNVPCPISGYIAVGGKTYKISCYQPLYIANYDVVAIPVRYEPLSWYEGNYYLIPAPPNASFVVYEYNSTYCWLICSTFTYRYGFLVAKVYYAPFDFPIYVVEPTVAVPTVVGWRHVGDIVYSDYYNKGFYHLYLADVKWRYYNVMYVNATINTDPILYYFLPRK
jgi:hypothetical protein